MFTEDRKMDEDIVRHVNAGRNVLGRNGMVKRNGIVKSKKWLHITACFSLLWRWKLNVPEEKNFECSGTEYIRIVSD